MPLALAGLIVVAATALVAAVVLWRRFRRRVVGSAQITGAQDRAEECRAPTVEARSTPGNDDAASVRGAFIPNSRCSSLIFVNQPAESIGADDYTVTPIAGGSRLRRLKRQSTMRSFLVVVPRVLSEPSPTISLPS